MYFNNLLNAITTETIIGIVAICAIVLSVFAIVLTAVKNFVKAKKSAANAEQDNSETLSVENTDEAIIADADNAEVQTNMDETAEEDLAEVENADTAIILSNNISTNVEVAQEEITSNIETEKEDIPIIEPIVESIEETVVEPTNVEEVNVESQSIADEVVATINASETEAIELTGFEKALIEAGAETIELYSLLKNYFLSFNSARSSASTNFDTYKVNKDIIARMIFVNNKLTVCLPIDAKDAKYSDKKYAHDDLSDNGTYAKVPFALTIRCGLNARRCMELFEIAVINQLKLVKNNAYVAVDYETKYNNFLNK